MSSPVVDIIQKPFDRKHTKEWVPDKDKKDIFFQMYIQERYRNLVFYVPNSRLVLSFIEKNGKDVLFFSFDERAHFWISKTKNSGFIEISGDEERFIKYTKKLKKTNKRFLLFQASTYEENGAHAITVLYDKLTKELELFQRNPGKEKYYPYEGTKVLLTAFFKKVFGKNIKPVYNNNLCIKAWDISNLCSSMHFEFYEKVEGDCLIWSLWYLELRLKNKDIPRRQVLNRVIKTFTKSIKPYEPDVNLACRVILGYRKFIDDFTDQFIVVKTLSGTVIRIDKKKTTPLLKKAERLLKTYLFLLGNSLNFIEKI